MKRTFSNNEKTYDVEKLWKAKGKVRSEKASKLLKKDYGKAWDTESGERISVEEYRQNPDKYPEHKKRVQEADLSYPILKRKNVIVDGLHRAAKAADGGDVISTRKLSRKDMRKALVKKAEEEKPKAPASMKDWFSPYPHQKKSVDKLFRNKGKLIMAHEMGTGKTVTSIYGVEKMKEAGKATNTLVVVPSGLRENFAKNGLSKFLKDPSFQVIASSGEGKRKNYVRPDKVTKDKEYTIVSYAMFRRDPIGIVKRSGADTIVMDEFHKLRSEKSSVTRAAMAARGHIKNFIGLTASLVNNQPSEIATLMAISEGKRYMTPTQFKERYTRTIGYAPGYGGKKKKIRGLQRHGELVENVTPRVDYVSTKALKGKSMPKKDVKFVDVPMSNDQWRLYQLALNKLGPVKKYVTRSDKNVIVKKTDEAALFTQTAHARQIANSVGMGRRMSLSESAKKTPKVQRILDDTAEHLRSNADGKVVLYSNLVRGGIDVLSAGLKDRGIDHAIFVGKGTEVGKNRITSKIRDLGISDYKAGKKKVVILSGAGAEGLDLPNTTAFFSLDGHFNPEKILQAEARGRRLGGQSHRPPEQRKLDVRRYRAIAPKSATPGAFAKRFMNKSTPQTTDQWVYSTARRKYMQNKELYTALEKPHLYSRKWVDASGKTRYEYPETHKPKKRGLFSKFLGTS